MLNGLPQNFLGSDFRYYDAHEGYPLLLNTPFIYKKPIRIPAAVAISSLIAIFSLAFKKGYITIEVVDEESPEENSDEYTI